MSKDKIMHKWTFVFSPLELENNQKFGETERKQLYPLVHNT